MRITSRLRCLGPSADGGGAGLNQSQQPVYVVDGIRVQELSLAF